MTEQGKEKERKISRSVMITGSIWLVTVVVMVVFFLLEKTPDMTIASAVCSWIVMPLALVAFLLSLLWNRVNDAKQVTIKSVSTVVLLFVFMFYLMFAVIMVWIAKVDNLSTQESSTILEIDEME